LWDLDDEKADTGGRVGSDTRASCGIINFVEHRPAGRRNALCYIGNVMLNPPEEKRRMISRRSFVQVSSASAFVAAVPAIGSSTASHSAEATALIRFAEQTHPRGLEARVDPRWRALSGQLVKAARDEPVAQFVVRAFALLAWFKDGHTTLWIGKISAGPFGLALPLRAAAFYDGLYVVGATPDLVSLVGKRITRIGEFTTNDCIRKLASIWPANNIAWPHHDAPLLLTNPGLLHGLGAVRGRDNAPILIEVTSGGNHFETGVAQPQTEIRGINLLQRTSTLPEQWAAEAKSHNYVRRLAQHQALYISLDDVGMEVTEFAPFLGEVLSAMAEPGWSKFILDLRRNPGGDNFLCEPLRKELARSRFNRPGGLYVFTSPTTFSAAQNLVNRLERETFAIFAGEPTGGAPRHYGDAKSFDSPKILQGGVSTMAWFDSYPMDNRPWVMPDMLIPRMFEDWVKGRDKVLEAVLADRTIMPPDETSPDRVFYFNRKSQFADWRPYWLA
jgi:hypothetical protein